MGKFISWVIWYGPFRTKESFKKALEKVEKGDALIAEGARLYLAVGHQKRISLRQAEILYVGQNSLKAESTLSARAMRSLFEEKRIRGWFNEYWYGVIQNSFTSRNVGTGEQEELIRDIAKVVDKTECALIYFADPLRNKECVFPANPFAFRIMNEFCKPWHKSFLKTGLERHLPKLIDYEHNSNQAGYFRLGSFSYRHSRRQEVNTKKRRLTVLRDREETDCWRQRITGDELTKPWDEFEKSERN